jgi:V/A-type H+-transporting ATPase subunit I
VLLGTVPATVDFDAMAGALAEAAEASDLRLLSQDREQKYLELLVHVSQQAEALEALRAYGFAFSQLGERTGTVSQNLREVQDEQVKIRQQREQKISAIRAMGGDAAELRLTIDRVSQRLATETTKERLLTGGAILYLDGWVDVPHIPELEKTLAGYDCAYELTDPDPEEYPAVPIKLQNNWFTRPMNMVTDMYSLPAYSGVDPNPLMAPFFILFYGMMMADMGYGLIMMILAAVVIKKTKPNGPTMRHMMPLMFLCGVSTFLWGAATGGFFGDFLTQIVALTTGGSFALPALFSPLDDAVPVLIGSLILGALQVFTGMAVSMYKQFKRGEYLAALANEGAWYLVFLLAALGILGVMPLKAAIICIVVVLVLGLSYGKKGFGIITGIFGGIYNGITGYFSDILSYSRLMALMLAGAVVAQVFNQLGAMTGNVITFVIIAMVGNALNFALNLLGCYVHDMRLQCLEFFGRFYEDGGKAFVPLNVSTKYVDIIND